LAYDKGVKQGGLSFWGGGTIIIRDNKTMELTKYEKE